MGITIFLEEEYGYRYWLWETGMDAEALMWWWSSLSSVDEYFFDPTGLPGKLTQLFDFTDTLVANVLSEDIEEDIKNKKLEKLFRSNPIWIKSGDMGYDPHATHLDVPGLTDGWTAHVHMNDDSWIKPPGNKKICLGGSDDSNR